MSKETKLERAFCQQWYHLKREEDDNMPRACSDIYIIADGQGPSGYYDRIHIELVSGKEIIAPAHHCESWEIRNTKYVENVDILV